MLSLGPAPEERPHADTDNAPQEGDEVIPPGELKGKAGQEARAMARTSFDAAPVRSVVGRLLNVHTDDRAWRKGAAGEEAIGKLLDKQLWGTI